MYAQKTQVTAEIQGFEVNGVQRDKFKLKCEIYLNNILIDTVSFTKESKKNSSVLVLSMQDRVRFVVKERDGDLFVGCISFAAETFAAKAHKTSVHWITLFDSFEDDEYDGELSEDDDETPRALFNFKVEDLKSTIKLEDRISAMSQIGQLQEKKSVINSNEEKTENKQSNNIALIADTESASEVFKIDVVCPTSNLESVTLEKAVGYSTQLTGRLSDGAETEQEGGLRSDCPNPKKLDTEPIPNAEHNISFQFEENSMIEKADSQNNNQQSLAQLENAFPCFSRLTSRVNSEPENENKILQAIEILNCPIDRDNKKVLISNPLVQIDSDDKKKDEDKEADANKSENSVEFLPLSEENTNFKPDESKNINTTDRNNARALR